MTVDTRSLFRGLLASVVAISLGCTLALAAESKPAAKKGEARKAPAGKRERIDCMVGTEDRQARIAIETVGNKVQSFAYYGKTKPRTCSMDVKRGDSYSKWEDKGDATIVTLIEDTGAFLINHEKNQYRFIFREIDRMRYCGMGGKINGSLTVSKVQGKNTCTVDSLFIDKPDEAEAEKKAN